MEDLATLVQQYTRTSKERVAAMIAAVRRIDAEGLQGDIVECGVWMGGNIIIARRLSPHRLCWLYDTFTGMTEPGPEDMSRNGTPALHRYRAKKSVGVGWCAASVADVTEALRKTETLDAEKVRFVVGPVEETLIHQFNLPDRIALLRLDTDWYASTRIEMEMLYPRLVPGGILIVDDYGHWQGARKAVNEYFGDAAPKMECIDYSAVMMVKPC